MTKIFFFLILFGGVIFTISPAYACDPLGCLMIGGHEQDALILGEIVAETPDAKRVEVTFIFPQTQDESLRPGKITVSGLEETLNLNAEKVETITLGKKYLMSLQKNSDFYIPRWGIYEVTSTNYANAELVNNNSIDDEALQIFINSGGTERDFAFDYSGFVPVLLHRKSEGEAVKHFDYFHPTAKGIFVYGSIFTLLVVMRLILKRKNQTPHSRK